MEFPSLGLPARSWIYKGREAPGEINMWSWNAWIRKQRTKAYNNGFDYACGALLRGEETPISLESAFLKDSTDPFSYGVADAIEQLISLEAISDNRL